MKRTIKFRAQRLDNGKWVCGDLEHNPGNKLTRIHTYDSKGDYQGQHIVNSETVGQFTGLLDRNGKEIYEGDILTCPEDVDFLPETVIFKEGCFMAKDDYTTIAMNAIDTDYRNITGNIYDNPELLK